MPFRRYRPLSILCLASALVASACANGLLRQEYEYEEEIYIALDGSATVNLNASIPALVALRGVDLDENPRSRLDRGRLRAMFDAPGIEVTRVSPYRRDGRRFVFVSANVSNLRQLRAVAPFSWSTYRFDRKGDVFEFRQVVGKAAAKAVGEVGWSGDELVRFRLHVPSEITFHNALAKGVQRGNILEWEQTLEDRLNGTPLELQAQMEPESILYTTLLLFGSTILAAAAVFGVAVWWVARRGRAAGAPAASRP